MVDLPQHAAQVATWHGWAQGGFDYQEYLWVNLRTPYLLANTLAFVLSWVVPVTTAFKLVISLAIVGIPLAALALLRESGGNPWWAVLVVPLGYSYAFFWGFVAFAVAIPLGLYILLRAWRYARAPTTRGAWLLFLLLHLLFLTHTVVFGWAGLTGALLVTAYSPGIRDTLRRWWPYLASLVAPLVWLALTLGLDRGTRGLGTGAFNLLRLLEAPGLVLGMPVSWKALGLGMVVLAIPFMTGGRWTRDLRRWIPLLMTVALFLATPDGLLGTGFLYRRFGILILPTLLFALEWPRVGSGRPWPSHLVLSVAALLWITVVATRFRHFRSEVGSFRTLVEAMEPNRRVLYLPLDRNSEVFRYPVFLHFGSWYQVEKGGLVDFSFAEFFPNLFRYHDRASPPLPYGFEWRPWVFDWEAHDGEQYDYLLFRSAVAPDSVIEASGAHVDLRGTARGGWWLFRSVSEAVERPRGERPPGDL